MNFKPTFLVVSLATVALLTTSCSKQENEPKSSKTDYEQIKESFDEFEKRITSFDLANYNIDKPNPIQEEVSAKCVNGFGGKSNKIYSGIFSENLYSLDAEKALTQTGYVGYLPYLKAYTLIGDILFEKHIDGFDRNAVTSAQLTRGFSNLQIFDGGRTVSNKFSTMESKFGFPVNYVKQQAGQIVTFADYNNDCEKNIRVIDRKYKKVSLGNRPIGDVLTGEFLNTSHHGTNGVYTVTTVNYHYLPENIINYLQSNQSIYKVISGNTWRFPEGAYLYVPDELNAISDTVRVDMSKANEFNGTLAEYENEMGLVNNNDKSSIKLVEEVVNGYRILKPYSVPLGTPLHHLGAVVIKDKKIFIAEWTPKGKATVSEKEYGSNYATMFNDKAITYLMTAIKQNYQGKKLDKGQDWEDMNIKLALDNKGNVAPKFNPTDLPLETVEQEKVREAINSDRNEMNMSEY